MTRAKSGLSIVVARKGIQPMEIIKTIIYLYVALTTRNRRTLPQCGRDDVVLYGLHSRDFKLQ